VADVSIVPDQRLVACGAKETILGAALREGIPFAHACGGRALCSTCRVLVIDGGGACTPRTTKERIAERWGSPTSSACLPDEHHRRGDGAASGARHRGIELPTCAVGRDVPAVYAADALPADADARGAPDR
jgi:ferredoxin